MKKSSIFSSEIMAVYNIKAEMRLLSKDFPIEISPNSNRFIRLSKILVAVTKNNIFWGCGRFSEFINFFNVIDTEFFRL